jgi:hypothetical protein
MCSVVESRQQAVIIKRMSPTDDKQQRSKIRQDFEDSRQTTEEGTQKAVDSSRKSTAGSKQQRADRPFGHFRQTVESASSE